VVGVVRGRRQRRREEARIRVERDTLDARMEDLSQALARAAAGDLSVTVDVDLGDERMTTLAQAFDATLTHLRGSSPRLRSAVSDSPSQRVSCAPPQPSKPRRRPSSRLP